jgi:hypothetical protein
VPLLKWRALRDSAPRLLTPGSLQHDRAVAQARPAVRRGNLIRTPQEGADRYRGDARGGSPDRESHRDDLYQLEHGRSPIRLASLVPWDPAGERRCGPLQLVMLSVSARPAVS